MKRSRQQLRLLATVALTVAALSTAPAIAGNGNGNDNGRGNGNSGVHGKSGGENKLLKADNKGRAKSSSHSSGQGGGFGALASELKKMNGAIHASFKAWTNASSNGVPGQARTYAESRDALPDFEGDIGELEASKQALLEEVSYEDYQNMIDALDPADYTEEGVFDEDAYNLDRDGLAALRDAEGTRTEEEIAAELEPIEERLDGEYALKSLTGGRELSEEAMGVFEARVDEYLESDEYLASKEIDEEPLLLTEEEVPVE